MTHTYARLEVSEATYDEIRGKLETAGYDHAFHGGTIDMHGIRLCKNHQAEDRVHRVRKPVDVEITPPSAGQLTEILRRKRDVVLPPPPTPWVGYLRWRESYDHE